MIEKIAGRYMSGKESRIISSTLHLERNELVVCDEFAIEIQRASLNEVKISTRIGAVPRKLDFPDCSSFETDENKLPLRSTKLQEEDGGNFDNQIWSHFPVIYH